MRAEFSAELGWNSDNLAPEVFQERDFYIIKKENFYEDFQYLNKKKRRVYPN